MIRLLRLIAQILVLVIVALASTLVSMRYAIHGREVTIPNFSGLTTSEAERAAFEHGLEISTSDHFYSAVVPAGRILSQQPEQGMRVRRGWRVRAAESLGPQLIEIPAVIGQSPRAAEINLRRRGLEIGEPAELPTADASPQAILAQTPSAGAQGVAAPRVSLLYAVPPPDAAFAMPDLTGMTFAEANALVAAAGLKTISVASAPGAAASGPATSGAAMANLAATVVTGQMPAAGSRVTSGTQVSFQTAHL